MLLLKTEISWERYDCALDHCALVLWVHSISWKLLKLSEAVIRREIWAAHLFSINLRVATITEVHQMP